VTAPAVRVERVVVEAVRGLRAAVLRPGWPLEESVYPEDGMPSTWHLAAVDAEGVVVGCSTWFPQGHDGEPAWRLRGMATAQQVRGTGVGGMLVSAGLDVVAGSGAPLVWCNARTTALPFYSRFGFVARGEEFLAAHGVPHFLMVCRIPFGSVEMAESGNSP
jgi:predicted GNAT family N-acyltransferase